MNFKKPTKKTFVEAAALTVGAVGGAAASRVVFGELPLKAPTNGGTDFMKIGARVLFIVGGTLGAASVTGSDVASSATKGAFAGMAIQQGIELVADFAKSSDATKNLGDSPAKSDTIKARVLGLACACDNDYSQGLGKPRRKALRAAVIDMSDYGSGQMALNSFEAASIDAKKYA